MTNNIHENENKSESITSGTASKSWILIAVNVLIVIVLFFIFNNKLPEQVASHYNIYGEQDNTMSKWGFWLMYAGVGIILPIFLSFVRYVDPRQHHYARFEGYFVLIRWAISLFIQVTFLFILLDNVGYKLPMSKLIIGCIGILWIFLGNQMGQLRSNFFVGIRTPWTLIDENNWRQTHRLAARLYVIAGFLMVIGACFASVYWLVGILLVSAATSTLIPVAYSYFLYRKSSTR